MKLIHNTKKAAMFGLDARIALAIFGALSVISGAALYSAIQQAKTVSAVTEMNEIGKAWEQFYLDTGVNPSKKSSNSADTEFYLLKTADFTDNPSINGWNGPYSTNGKATDSDFLKSQTFNNIVLTTLPDESWNHWNTNLCTTGKKCFLWILVNAGQNESLAKSIDEFIDGSDGNSAGNFRYYKASGDNYELSLKYAPIANPNY
tara:strand:+ start:13481 stop:14092 length:612 start_codon:yes stop_codon:yes gene_type:complete